MPPQARLKARERAGPAAVHRFSGAEHRPQGLLPVHGRLMHPAHGDTTPCEVGAETGASRPGGEWARHFRAVADAALLEETPQPFPRRRLAAALEFDRNHRIQAQLLRTQNTVGDEPDRTTRSQHLRGGLDAARHALGPALGPTVSGSQPTHHAVLTPLLPVDPAVPAPAGDAEIAVEGQPVARFLMRPKPEKTCLAMQALELLHGLATPQQQTPPAPGPLRLQVPERFGDEAGVRRIPLG